MSSEPIRQPANDLVAFDISKQSPEQIALLFARWKEQRKRLTAPASQRPVRPPHLRPVPPVARGAAKVALEPLEEAREAATPQSAAEESGPIHYSASFEALLTAREPSLAQRVWNPNAGLQRLGRPHPPRRRSRMKWVLAGAASVLAVAAVAGGTLWEQVRPGGMQAGTKPAADAVLVASPAEAALPATPSYPTDIPMMEPFVATAVAAGEADWPMQRAVDLALMTTVPVAETAALPLMPQLKPPVPAVQTASKPAPATATQAAATEAPIARVELPLVSSVTTATVSVPVAPVGEARDDDPRRDGATSRGNDKGNYTFGANNRVASSKPADTTGSGGSAKPGSSTGGAPTGGADDPSAGGTGDNGSTGTGGDGSAGSGSGGSSSGGDPGTGTGGGDTGGGTAGGSDPGGGTGGGDTGGSDPGGDAGGGDTGGDSGAGGGGDTSGDGASDGGDTGSGDTGGSGESGESGGSTDSGIGGAIGGAIGGLGDALGGALGGGKGAKADKDKDKGKDKAD